MGSPFADAGQLIVPEGVERLKNGGLGLNGVLETERKELLCCPQIIAVVSQMWRPPDRFLREAVHIWGLCRDARPLERAARE